MRSCVARRRRATFGDAWTRSRPADLDRLPLPERARPAVHDDARAPAAALVEVLDPPAPLRHQWTIFEIGSSMIPVAPWSLSAGMSVLISDLATTASTA